MTSFLFAAATLNLIMGITFIVKGIKKKGKKRYFKEMGVAYIFWVAISTSAMIYGAIIN